MFDSWLQSRAQQFVLGTLKRIEHGQLKVTTKYQGEKEQHFVFGQTGKHTGDDTDEITVVVKDPNVWTRLCQAFDLGFAEAYMLQEVDCNNLVGLFSLYISNRNALGFSGGNLFYQLMPRITRILFRPKNNASNARKHAGFHYDTSNDLFQAFLSPDMNYSSALWCGQADEPLELAQRRKIHNILDKAKIESHHHILDIGCGWGYLAMEAVKTTGCRVTGLTLSVEQKTLAEERIQAAELQDKIEILLCDYRKAPAPPGGYDRIVSVEMLEHVGEKYLKSYFATISKLLKLEGGIMAVQGITNINYIYENSPKVDTFIDRYVFPGGYLPTIKQLLAAIHAGSKGTLEIEAVQNIGPHYIRTLQCWRENFDKNWDSIRKSFAERHEEASEDDIEFYHRRWLYYFMYCESGFRTRILGDYVISAVRTPEPDIPSDIPH